MKRRVDNGELEVDDQVREALQKIVANIEDTAA